MDTQTFFDNFGYIVDAPNGIQQLRNLILRLAIEGKLSKQYTYEVSGKVLLEELKAIKVELVKKKLTKDSRISSPNPHLEEFKIPSSWTWCRVLDVCDLKTGATPSRQKHEYFGGDIKWLVSGDIHKREIFDCEGRITEKGLNASNCKILPEDSVLIALNGQGKTRATVAILRIPASCNQSLVSMTPFNKSKLLPEYLYLNLLYRYYEIREITGQKQRRGLNMKLVGELSISLPPTEEQKRIVTKVNQLMAICDQLETQRKQKAQIRLAINNASLDKLLASQTPDEFNQHWQRIANNFHHLYDNLENLNSLRSAILQFAIQGKLESQISCKSTAKELLVNIATDKQEVIRSKKYSCLKPLSNDEIVTEPFKLPKKWSWAILDSISYTVHYGYTASANHKKTDVRLLRITDIQNNKVNWDTVPGCDINDKSLKANQLADNDILIARTGGTIGKTYLVEDLPVTAVFASYLIRVVPSMLMNPRYMKLFMESPLYWQQLYAKSMGTGQPNVNATSLRTLLVPVPPIEIQNYIVAKVDQLMSICDQLESKIKQANNIQQKLTEATIKSLAA